MSRLILILHLLVYWTSLERSSLKDTGLVGFAEKGAVLRKLSGAGSVINPSAPTFKTEWI